MATNFPTSIDSYTTKVNNVDTIDASHINNLQDATVAVENILGAASTRRTSWTPTIAFSGGSTGMTYTSSGSYARFGSIIFIQGEFTLSAKGSSTGDLRVTNLPVNAADVQCAIPVTLIFPGVFTTFAPMVGRTGTGANASVLDFYNVSGVTWTRINDTHTQNTSSCRFSGFYFHV